MRISIGVVALAGVLLLHASTASAQDVNDAQIASIVVTANQVDIDAGRLLTSKSAKNDVKTFARLMITDHTAVNKSATDLAAKLGVTPQDNATSQSLRAEGDKNVASEPGRFDSRTIETEKSWRFTARTAGEFPYVCTFHPTMKAMLNVK
jgi:putative membrane protein